MTKLKKGISTILLSIMYPVWFFFAKTWLGGVLMLCLIPSIPGILVGMLFQDIMANTLGEAAQDIASGFAIFSILLSPFIAIPIIYFSGYLERNYIKMQYNTRNTFGA